MKKTMIGGMRGCGNEEWGENMEKEENTKERGNVRNKEGKFGKKEGTYVWGCSKRRWGESVKLRR